MLSAPELSRLKAAQKRLVLRCGGQEACALVPGMRLTRHQSFNEFGKEDMPERHMPLDVAMSLSRFGGLDVVRTMAELLNCLLVPLPMGGGYGQLAEGTGRTAKEIGDVMVRIGEAMRDGKIDPSEGAAILVEIHEAMVCLAALAEAVKAEVSRQEVE